jgi:hypothetical protein
MPSNICTGGGDEQEQESAATTAAKSDGEITTVGEKKGRFRSLISRNKGAKEAMSDSSGGSFDDGLATSAGAQQQSLSLSAPVDTVPLHAASGSLMRSEPTLPTARETKEKKKTNRKSGKQTKPTSDDVAAAAPKLQRIKPVCDLNSLCVASRPGAAASASASAEGDSVSEDHDSPAADEGASEVASESESTSEPATPRDSSEFVEDDDKEEEDGGEVDWSLELESEEDDEAPTTDELSASGSSPTVVASPLPSTGEPFSPIHVNGTSQTLS